MLKDRATRLAMLLPRPLRRLLKTRVAPPAFRAVRRLKGGTGAKSPARAFRVADAETFAGYYDIEPVSPDGTSLLAHAASVRRQSLGPTDGARVGWFDLGTGDFHQVAETRLWNWQMGARLRWWKGERADALAFNTVHASAPACCVGWAGSEPRMLLPLPLFDISRDQRIGLSLNFGRLARCRPGYGYAAVEDPFAGELLPAGDGVVIADLATGKSSLAYSLVDFSRLLDEPVPGALHYLNAGSLSPSGKHFSVLHKYLPDPGNVNKWVVHAVIGRSDGSRLFRVPLPGNASHYWWIDDERIVYTANRGPASSYVLYDCRDQSLTSFSRAAPGIDGHPSCTQGGEEPLWITDQYPDLYGEQALYQFRAGDERCVELARFLADPRYQDEWRCDLHPRWSGDGRSVLVDSTHEGFRAIYSVAARPG